MRVSICQFTFFLLFPICEAVLKVGVSELVSDLVPDYIRLSEEGECEKSFECDLLQKICEGLKEECEIVVLDDLEHRLDAVQEGDVNMSISLISVNVDRAEKVHFVRPYYYYAGVRIFVPETLPQDQHPDWDDLQNSKVCMLEDYFAIEAVGFVYKPQIVTVEHTNSSLIEEGLCDYILTESTQQMEGMTASIPALVKFGAPYGIAVAHQARETLGARIGEVLVDLMDDGMDSEILKIEQETLIENGYPQNVKLLDIVLTVTRYEGPIPPQVEDSIWDE